MKIKFLIANICFLFYFVSNVTLTYATDTNTPIPKTMDKSLIISENNETTFVDTILPSIDNSIDTKTSTHLQERFTLIETFKNIYPNYGYIDATHKELTIYEEPNIESLVMGYANGKVLCFFEEYDETWYKITSNNVIGYIQKEYVVTNDDIYIALYLEELETTIPYIIVNKSIKAYDMPNGKSIQNLSKDDVYIILEQDEDWIKIVTKDNQELYIKKENVIIFPSEIILKETTQTNENSYSNFVYADKIYQVKTSWLEGDDRIAYTEEELIKLRQELVEYACSFEGNPYVWGGVSLTNGADCSGFVQSIYRDFGFTLPRTSCYQETIGIEVSLEDIQPGDLIFYPSRGFRVGHVGIYVGNDTMIDAHSTADGIQYTNIYYKEMTSIKRIIG